MHQALKRFLYIVLALGLFVSCNKPTPDPPKPEPIDTDTPDVVHGDTLPGHLPRIPLHRTFTHAQPMTGLVLWLDQARNRHAEFGNSISLEFAYCLPCRAVTGKENEEIQYNWNYVDSILDDVASRNHQAVLRFRFEYPGNREVDGVAGSTAVPAYIKADPEYHETFNNNDDGPTYYADWNSSELKWFTKQFYTDFAERYNYDPRLAFVEVGFGHWSEYHIYGTELMLGTNFPSHEYQAEFLEHMAQVMEKPWLISIDAADDTYTPIVGSTDLMALNFGNFDDSFMHRDHEGDYNEECWIALGYQTRWKRAPHGGEISYYSSRDQRGFLNPDGLYGHTWEEQAAKYHITFMIANDAPGTTYGTPQRFLEAALASGYKFKVLDVKGDADSTLILVTNIGVAPIYAEANFSIGQISANQSLSYLMPGDTGMVTLYASMQSGKPLEIYSPAVLDDQVIEFEANVGQ